LSEEIISILSNAGYKISEKGDMTMELIFKPAFSGGVLWDWRVSAIVNTVSEGKIWERYRTFNDTGKRSSQHVFDLTPAYEVFIESVND
ncbi:MAG: hypothetical protein GTO02_20310, partial [Candidatus Dadabacteria bacterium]|nr:hypothetical protein [Candidatus Dadabacteria bacterium]